MSLDAPTTTLQLGDTDLKVGPIAYGCWRFADTADAAVGAQAKIEAALDAGMNLIDTADIYGVDGPGGFGSAEALLGDVLRAAPELRDQMVLATKGGIVPGVPYDSTDLRAACEASLRRLGVDVIDLYQVHRPDLLAHPGAVAEALTGLVEDGLVRAVGVSNHSASQFRALQAHMGPVRLATVQPEFSLAHLDPLDDGVLDQAMTAGCTPLAWSPLGGGRLLRAAADKRAVGEREVLDSVLTELAVREGVATSAVALAWVMAHPSSPVPIIGTQRPDRIREAAAATRFELSRADWYRLTEAAGRDLP